MPRVYVPNPILNKLATAKKELYLLKTAVKTSSEEKIVEKIDQIREILVEITDHLESNNEGG